MLYAIDTNGLRITPFPKGKASCPYCKSEMKSVCGDIKIHHWRHDKKCDPWKEPETYWHRQWKKEFPETWQEVIIKKEDKTHIADIKTSNGLVIEFQNSSISNRIIELREHFYGNMIWVVNAQEFKDNFDIWSIVKSELYRLKNQSNDSWDDFCLDDELKEYNNRLKILIEKRESDVLKKEELEQKKSKAEIYNSELIETTIKLIENEWLGYKDPLYKFKPEALSLYSNINLQINKKKDLLKDLQNKVDNIRKYPKMGISGYENYRKVPFELVKESSFNLCVLVEKGQKLFPNIIKMKTQSEFRWFSNKKDEYNLLINLDSKEKDLSDKIIKLNSEIKKCEIKKASVKEKIMQELKNYLDSFISYSNEKIESISVEIDNFSINMKQLEMERLSFVSKRNKEVSEVEKKREKRINAQKSKIMLTYKGLYGYNWKYRRRSWDYANKKVYLDFGNYLFEILSEENLRKIEKENFIKKINDTSINS